jgi:hypothetical protein
MIRKFIQTAMYRSPRPAVLLFALLFTGCASVVEQQGAQKLIPGDANAPSQVTPSEAMETACIYSTHPWRPFATNIKHGVDPAGIRVDTPDAGYHPANGRNGWWVPGDVNEGIPYKWGGFDDPASFDAAIASGHAAGDVSTPAKRQADNASVSQFAAGVDCSGFVSRCLHLPVVYDSAHLASICVPLPSPQELRAGDLLYIPGLHVMLVAGWANSDHTQILYYETGGIPDWKPGLKISPLDKLLALGFKPLRYRGMAQEEVPSGKEVLTRAIRSSAISVPNPVVGEP